MYLVMGSEVEETFIKRCYVVEGDVLVQQGELA
jgi:hypothetical protein